MRTGVVALLLAALAPVEGAAQASQRVGEVVRAAPKVQGRPTCDPASSGELAPKSPVCVGMEIETSSGAGARIAINRDLRQQQGAVILGPRTIVELTEQVVNQALGLETMSWLVKLGQFRLALFPPPPGAPLAEGEYKIVTPDKTEVRLRGTDVAVQVDRNGTTTVWVIEGKVEVKAAAGGTVLVSAGYRTRVRRGHEPEPPVRFGTGGGPGPGVSAPPEETIFPDPPDLDLRALRLDLPQ